MPHRRVLLVVVVAALSACSSRSHATHRAKPLAPPAARYLQLAGSANAAIDEAKGRLRTGTEDLAATQADLRAIAEAKRTFDHDLLTVQFAPAVRPAIQKLIDADNTLESRLDAGAAARTPAELAAMSPAILSAGQSCVTSADAVRRLLGLPPLG